MKNINEYKIGDFVFWKSHEGIKSNGSGKVIDTYESFSTPKQTILTAKNSYETVSLIQSDLR